MNFEKVKNLWEGEILKKMHRFENQVQFASCFQSPDMRKPKLPCPIKLLLDYDDENGSDNDNDDRRECYWSVPIG